MQEKKERVREKTNQNVNATKREKKGNRLEDEGAAGMLSRYAGSFFKNCQKLQEENRDVF